MPEIDEGGAWGEWDLALRKLNEAADLYRLQPTEVTSLAYMKSLSDLDYCSARVGPPRSAKAVAARA